jgi:hypothetical protein
MISSTEFWTICGLFLTFIGGVFAWALWVSKQISALTVTAGDNHERIVALEEARKKENESQMLERELLSREITTGNLRIFDKLDSIIHTVGEIKITCGRHDQRILTIEKAVTR